jgi:acetyl esterase/lipase
MKKIVSFLLLSTIGIHSFLGQIKVIELWNGKVPEAIENPDYKLLVDSGDNWIKMRFVTQPVMDMYPAPANIATGAAVIICPGGGYWGIAISHEGEHVAKWFNSIGITAFVLKYRLPDKSIMKDPSIGPLQDGQEAVRIVRRNAKAWNISPDKIGIMGFSDGGHLASTISTHYLEKVYTSSDSVSARPDFSILIYPVISMDAAITHMGSRDNLLGKDPSAEKIMHFSNELQVNGQTPPAFIVHSLDDNGVLVQNSINYAYAMKKNNVPCELHIYETGGHGYGLGRSSGTESSWPDACKRWLKARRIL